MSWESRSKLVQNPGFHSFAVSCLEACVPKLSLMICAFQGEQLSGKPASRGKVIIHSHLTARDGTVLVHSIGSACCTTCAAGEEKYVAESDDSCQEARNGSGHLLSFTLYDS